MQKRMQIYLYCRDYSSSFYLNFLLSHSQAAF